jgi:small GTP-binding protein
MQTLDRYQVVLLKCFAVGGDDLSKEIKEKLLDAHNIFLYRILPFIKMKEITISIFGSGGSGKTTFIKRLKGEFFNPSYSPTTGIVRHVIERYNYRVNILDYAGQDMYILRNTLHLDKIHGAILMCKVNTRLSYYNSVEWYRNKLGSIPLIIIQNQLDTVKDFIDYGQKENFWNISCKNKKGVEEVFDYLLYKY